MTAEARQALQGKIDAAASGPPMPAGKKQQAPRPRTRRRP